MKILYIVDRYPTLSETFVSDQVEALRVRGHDVRVIGWTSGLPSSWSSRLMHTAKTALCWVKKGMWQRFGLMSPVYRKMALSFLPVYVADMYEGLEWEPDAVIAHFGNNGLIASVLKRAGVIPQATKCLNYIHAYEISGLSVKETARVYSPLFKDGTLILPVNSLWADKLIKAGAAPSSVQVSHMGIDLGKFTFRLPEKPGDTLRILTVGRLVEKKGHEYAIRAVARYRSSTGRNVKYTIIGDGPLKESLSALIKDLGMEHYIEMAGGMDHKVILARLRESDIFILTSVTSANGDMEGIPVSLMEAMATGVLCISTYHSGIPELIGDRWSGFLCRERNVDDIVAALNEATALDIKARQEMAIAARQKVEQEFDACRLLTQLETLLQ